MDVSKLLDQVALDHKANSLNANRGTEGTNRVFDQAQGNRGKQMNPNQKQPTQDTDDALEEGDVFGGSEASD